MVDSEPSQCQHTCQFLSINQSEITIFRIPTIMDGHLHSKKYTLRFHIMLHVTTVVIIRS